MQTIHIRIPIGNSKLDLSLLADIKIYDVKINALVGVDLFAKTDSLDVYAFRYFCSRAHMQSRVIGYAISLNCRGNTYWTVNKHELKKGLQILL